MEAFLTSILGAIIINACSAGYSPYPRVGLNESSTSTIILASVLPGVVLIIAVIVVIVFICKAKRANKAKMNVAPLSTEPASAQCKDQNGAPSYHKTPTYGQLPVYEQPPPSYSTISLQPDPTKTMFTS